jgi:hypothetical protein
MGVKKHKDAFEKTKKVRALRLRLLYGSRFTQALKEFPMNIAVDGDKIIKRKYKSQEWLPHYADNS